MSLNLPSHYTIQFSSNVQLLLQQKGSKLSGAVSRGQYVGKQASPVDQVGKVVAQRVTSRFAPMSRVDAPVDRRWVFPSDYDLPQNIDTFDKLRLVTELDSTYVQNAYYAMGRAQDTEILNAVFGTAKTGEQGATSTSYTSGNTAATVSIGGTNSRINVEKLIVTRELMRANFVDFEMDEIYVGLTAKDEGALLREVQITSADFNGGDKPVLKDGKVIRFLGFNFIPCELIETVCASSGKVTLPVWAKSGLHLGTWMDLQTSISKRNDLQGEPWQAYVMATMGATRLEENKVYGIESYR
jgi:hypothetical protein